MQRQLRTPALMHVWRHLDVRCDSQRARVPPGTSVESATMLCCSCTRSPKSAFARSEFFASEKETPRSVPVPTLNLGSAGDAICKF